MSEKDRDPKIQGEGDYESARRYRRSASPKTPKRNDRRLARSSPGLRFYHAKERSAPRTVVEC